MKAFSLESRPFKDSAIAWRSVAQPAGSTFPPRWLGAKGSWDGEGLRLYLDAMKRLRGNSSSPEFQAVLAGPQTLSQRNVEKSSQLKAADA